MSQAHPFPSAGRPQARILIIDDNPEIHRDFKRSLAARSPDQNLAREEELMYGRTAPERAAEPGYALDSAFSGLEGLAKVRAALEAEQPYQLAFVDVRMPGIDGVETIARLWKIDPNVQIVLCTAYSDFSWSELAQRLGPTDKLLVLKKPFDLIEVTQLASTLTEKWHLTRQAALKQEQMELLVSRHAQKLLNLQRAESGPAPPKPEAAAPDEPPEPPQILTLVPAGAIREEIHGGLGSAFRLLESDRRDLMAQAEEIVPDLIVIGIASADDAGLALCRRLKASEITSHIPIIILSPSDAEAWHLQALEAGADDYIVTPRRPALLKARVDNILESRRRLHERFQQEKAMEPRDFADNQSDGQFLRRMVDVVESHLSDFEFDVEALAQKMGVSRRQLFRKFKAITGRTPNLLIRKLRLDRAAGLLQSSNMTIAEITFAVGFLDVKHFRVLFKEQFGALPSDYLKTKNPPPAG
ncbi:MAG TPA: helix-turn-helix domain-containing protein [Verrucomicrobiae bacterium]|nr:helix-turn-helix domain-containing protein [Verrucomicrobiae bacterium]